MPYILNIETATSGTKRISFNNGREGAQQVIDGFHQGYSLDSVLRFADGDSDDQVTALRACDIRDMWIEQA